VKPVAYYGVDTFPFFPLFRLIILSRKTGPPVVSSRRAACERVDAAERNAAPAAGAKHVDAALLAMSSWGQLRPRRIYFF
jgi:hypothetical protein